MCLFWGENVLDQLCGQTHCENSGFAFVHPEKPLENARSALLQHKWNADNATDICCPCISPVLVSTAGIHLLEQRKWIEKANTLMLLMLLISRGALL